MVNSFTISHALSSPYMTDDNHLSIIREGGERTLKRAHWHWSIGMRRARQGTSLIVVGRLVSDVIIMLTRRTFWGECSIVSSFLVHNFLGCVEYLKHRQLQINWVYLALDFSYFSNLDDAGLIESLVSKVIYTKLRQRLYY